MGYDLSEYKLFYLEEAASSRYRLYNGLYGRNGPDGRYGQ